LVGGKHQLADPGGRPLRRRLGAPPGGENLRLMTGAAAPGLFAVERRRRLRRQHERERVAGLERSLERGGMEVILHGVEAALAYVHTGGGPSTANRASAREPGGSIAPPAQRLVASERVTSS